MTLGRAVSGESWGLEVYRQLKDECRYGRAGGWCGLVKKLACEGDER